MTALPVVGAVTGEREKFEAWSRSRADGGFTLERLSDGRYTHYNTQWCWETWQAARAELGEQGTPS